MRMLDGRARVLVSVLAASVALMTVVGSVAAAPRPEPVTIVSPMTVSDTGPNFGTFTTSGTELICGGGPVVDTRYVWGGVGNPNGA